MQGPWEQLSTSLFIAKFREKIVIFFFSPWHFTFISYYRLYASSCAFSPDQHIELQSCSWCGFCWIPFLFVPGSKHSLHSAIRKLPDSHQSLTSDCTPHTLGTASSDVQYCFLPKGKQDYPTLKTVPTQQEKPGSAARVAQALVPWPGLDLGLLIPHRGTSIWCSVWVFVPECKWERRGRDEGVAVSGQLF